MEIRPVDPKNMTSLERAYYEIGFEKGFKIGFKIGFERAQEEIYNTEVIQRMLSMPDFTIAEIANFVGVSQAFVRKVKKGSD